MASFETDRRIAEELDPGERLLWSGSPKRGLRLRAGDALVIPLSLLWGGFAIFWEAGVLIAGAPWFFALWGIPFVLVGLYLIVGRFFVDAWRRAATVYALTERRVIVLSGIFSHTVKSLPLRTLPEISLNVKSDGSGTISFGSTVQWPGWYGNSGWPGYQGLAPVQFELIDNAREVYAKVRAAQSACA